MESKIAFIPLFYEGGWYVLLTCYQRCDWGSI